MSYKAGEKNFDIKTSTSDFFTLEDQELFEKLPPISEQQQHVIDSFAKLMLELSIDE